MCARMQKGAAYFRNLPVTICPCSMLYVNTRNMAGTQLLPTALRPILNNLDADYLSPADQSAPWYTDSDPGCYWERGAPISGSQQLSWPYYSSACLGSWTRHAYMCRFERKPSWPCGHSGGPEYSSPSHWLLWKKQPGILEEGQGRTG